jgi:hypothetical protein
MYENKRRRKKRDKQKKNPKQRNNLCFPTDINVFGSSES